MELKNDNELEKRQRLAMALKITAVFNKVMKEKKEKKGNLESNTSPSSLSFLRRAQELKDNTEHERSKDDSVIETRNNYSLKSRKRPESFNLKAGRNRPQSWHPTAGDGTLSELKLRSQSESSDYNNELTIRRDIQSKATAMPISEYERENPFRENFHNNIDKQLIGNPYHSMQNLRNAKTLSTEQLHSSEYSHGDGARRSYGGIPSSFHGLSQAKSTPALNKEQSEKDRKSSVYQTLNVKSGLNFSPTKQRRGHGPWEKSTWDSYSEQNQYGYDNTGLRPWENQECRTGYRPVNASSHRLIHRSHSNYENVLYEDTRENEAPGIPPIPNDHYQHIENQPPPSPPLRDASSLKYIQGSPIHERYPSWPVKEKIEKQHQQFQNAKLNSTWSSSENKSIDISHISKGIPTHYNKLRNEKQQNKDDLEAREVSPKQPNFRTDNIHRATVAKVSSLDDDEDYIKLKKTFPLQSNAGDVLSYMGQVHYPPPMFDSHGKGLGDKDYTVPSPPERDVPVLINSDHVHNALENSDLSPDSKNMIAQYQATMQSNCSTPTNDVHQSGASSLSTTPIADRPDSQNESYTYLVHSVPHYNTSTQTDVSPKDNKTTWTNVALKRQETNQNTQKDMHSKYDSKSDNKFVSSGTQMSPTENDPNIYLESRVPEIQDNYSHNSSQHSFIDQWDQDKEFNDAYKKNNDDYMNMNEGNNYSNYVNMGPAPGETDVYSFAKAKVVKIQAKENQSPAITQDNNFENGPRLHVNHQYTDSAPMLRKLSEEMYRQKHNEERHNARLRAEREAQRHTEFLEQQRQIEEEQRKKKKQQEQRMWKQEQRKIEEQKKSEERELQRIKDIESKHMQRKEDFKMSHHAQDLTEWAQDIKLEKLQAWNEHVTPVNQENLEEPSTPEPVAPPRKKRDSIRKVRRQDMKNRQSVLDLQDRAIVKERLATFETEVLSQSNTSDIQSPQRKISMKRAYGIFDDTDQIQEHKDNRLESVSSHLNKPQARQENSYSPYDSKQLGQIAEEDYTRNLSEPRDQRIAQIERMAKDIEQRKPPGKLKRTVSEQIRPIKQRDLEHERHSTSRGRLESEERNVPQRRESLRETGRPYGASDTVLEHHERKHSDNAVRATEPFDMKRSSRSSSHGSESEHEHNKSRETIEGYNIRPSGLSYDLRKRPVSGQVFVGGKIDGKQPEIRKTQQQALLNFYSMKTGKRVESSSSQISAGESSDSEKVPKEQYGITLPGYNSDIMAHTLPLEYQHEFQKPERPNRNSRSVNLTSDAKHMRASSDSSGHREMSSRSNHDSRRSTNSSTSSHDRSSSHHSWERERPASISVSSDEKGPSLAVQVKRQRSLSGRPHKVQQQLLSSSHESKEKQAAQQTHQLSRTYEYPSSRGNLESNTSPSSLSFLRRAQELKDNTEHERSKDDSVIETRNNYSLKKKKVPTATLR